MKQLQKERRQQPASHPRPAQTAKPAPAPAHPPAGPPAPPPDHAMSEDAEAHPVFCAPATTDTR
ncbi:MAG: hypothetical protein ABSF64_17665 [Bryobacteraceae bacterium]